MGTMADAIMGCAIMGCEVNGPRLHEMLTSTQVTLDVIASLVNDLELRLYTGPILPPNEMPVKLPEEGILFQAGRLQATVTIVAERLDKLMGAL